MVPPVFWPLPSWASAASHRSNCLYLEVTSVFRYTMPIQAVVGREHARRRCLRTYQGTHRHQQATIGNSEHLRRVTETRPIQNKKGTTRRNLLVLEDSLNEVTTAGLANYLRRRGRRLLYTVMGTVCWWHRGGVATKSYNGRYGGDRGRSQNKRQNSRCAQGCSARANCQK